MTLAPILKRGYGLVGISHLANDILKQVAKFLRSLSFWGSALGSHIIHLILRFILGASDRRRVRCLVNTIIYEHNRFGNGLLIRKDIGIILGARSVDAHATKLAFH